MRFPVSNNQLVLTTMGSARRACGRLLGDNLGDSRAVLD